MKRNVIIVLLFFTSQIFAHYGEAHQHMVREAYKLLRYQLGYDIPELASHIGEYEKGTYYFTPGGKVVIGAYREDEEDIVNEVKTAGYHEAEFSALSCGDGSNLSSGIYIYRLSASSLTTGEQFTKSAKMILMK